MSHNWLHTPDCKVLNEYRTMQGIVMGAAQMLTSSQGCHNRTSPQNRDDASTMRHGLPNVL
jgi:hypothetical protein